MPPIDIDLLKEDPLPPRIPSRKRRLAEAELRDKHRLSGIVFPEFRDLLLIVHALVPGADVFIAHRNIAAGIRIVRRDPRCVGDVADRPVRVKTPAICHRLRDVPLCHPALTVQLVADSPCDNRRVIVM